MGESNRYTISGVCFCEHILFQIYGSLPRIHVTVYVYRRLFQKLTQHAGLYTRIPYSSADVDNESFMMHSLNFPRVLLAPRIGRTTPKREGSEDCLYLNVYVPSDANHTSKLPCFLWIHGGGYEYGASNEYNASKLVTDWWFEICVIFICIIFSFLFGMIIPYNVPPPSHKLVYKPINYSL